MELDRRIDGFIKLGRRVKEYLRTKVDPVSQEFHMAEFDQFEDAVRRATEENPWFTEENILHMLTSVAEMLDQKALARWLDPYRERMRDRLSGQTVAVIMPGNIPMVGFHDFLCTLITGNRIIGRLSSEDSVLIPVLADVLIKGEPLFDSRIRFTREKLVDFDAVIATGSDASARQFEYYFSKVPRLIRGNRNSAAILTGDETREEMTGLGEDMFRYFGRGCRSVSHLYVPQGYDPEQLTRAFPAFSGLSNHHKYRNNYDYRKSLLMMNGSGFFDGSFYLLVPDERLNSPVSVIHYSCYSDRSNLMQHVEKMEEKIQVVVARTSLPFRSCPFGRAQHPALNDYSDGIDTLDFLLTPPPLKII